MSIVSCSFIGAEKKTLTFLGHFLVSEILGRSGSSLFKIRTRAKQAIYICLIFCIMIIDYSVSLHYCTFQTTSITLLDVFLSLHRKSFDLTFKFHLDIREDS